MYTARMFPRKILKTVYLVRHGQTSDNIRPIFQPPDSVLNEQGHAQAAQLAERIARIKFDTLIASPWPRAKETAAAVSAATGKEIIYSDLFVERIKPTNLNGKSYDDPEAEALWKEWARSLHTPGYRVEDGENFDDITGRADAALKFLEDRPETDLVVVTHGIFLRTMVSRVLLGDSLTGENFEVLLQSAETENTGITVLQYREGHRDTRWRLWIFNDHNHLG